MPTLLLVDGNAIIHRAFHALPRFTAPDGRPTGAVYGFFSTLLSAIKQFESTHVALTFDVAGPTFRHKEYKDYKATRIKAPQELYDQIPMIQEILKTMNVPQFGVEGFEADDVIATIVAKIPNSKSQNPNKLKIQKSNPKTIILTGDLDALQLVSELVSVCALRRGIKDSIIYNEKTVKETFGFEPKYIIEYKALRGDPSDNIPGVPGIGAKTAGTLINQYHTIDNLYRHLDNLPSKIKTILRSHKNELELGKRLVQLRDDVPINFSLDEAKISSSKSEVIKKFESLGMKSIAKRIQEMGEAKQGTLL